MRRGCQQQLPGAVLGMRSVTGEMKHPGAFAPRYQQCTTHMKGIRRCKECSERCSTCKQYMADDRGFATNTNVCWKCYKESLKRMCERCAAYKECKNFNSDLLKNNKTRGDILVCLDCYKMGYSNDKQYGLKTYRCIGGHDCGHLDFRRQLFWNYNRRHTSASQLICEDCRIKPKKCQKESLHRMCERCAA